MQVLRRAVDEVVPGVRWTPHGFARLWFRVAVPKIYRYDRATYGVETMEVPAETLRDPESLATLIGCPVTIDHPGEDVTPATIARDRVGVVLAVELHGGEPCAEVQLDTPAGLALASRKDFELTCSPGYHFESGPSDVADIRQERRVYNHVAILDQSVPRGGARCRALLTATDGVPMDTEKLSALLAEAGVSAEKLPDLLAALAALMPPPAEDMDPAKEKAMDAKAQVVALSAKLAAAEAKAAAAEKRAKDAVAAAEAAEIRVLGPEVLAAAKAQGIGDGADIVKVAEQVGAKVGLSFKGLDAVRAVAASQRLAPPTRTQTAPAWRGEVVADGKPAADADKTTSSMEC